VCGIPEVVALAQRAFHTIADLKVVSQNLMHSSFTVMDDIYGACPGTTLGSGSPGWAAIRD
jgi:hypothetical protein